ncbi:MAG: hypothetical protein H0Z38_09155 [Firmicutes bacterium]|nr:hypothetical protein [Bacillota bacterium]
MQKLMRIERGQALIVLIFVLAGMVVLACGLAETASQVVDRLKLQNLADGSALQAGVVMADGLNLIALTNASMLALGIGAFFSGGKTLSYIRKIQRFQDQLIRSTPKLAAYSALLFGIGEEMDFRYLMEKPEMRVKRRYLKFLWFKIPLWCEDASDIHRRKTTVAFFRNHGGDWATTASSFPRGGRLIGKYILWPLPSPDYEPYLVPAGN